MQFVLVLLFNCLIALGSVLGGCWLAFVQYQRINQWVETPAVITASPVGAPEHVRPYIEYSYQYDGMSITGRRIFPMEFWTGTESAERMAAHYPVGVNTFVRVKPGNPEMAYLVPRAHFLPFGMMLIAPLLGLLIVPKFIEGGVFARAPDTSGGGNTTYYRTQIAETLQARTAGLVGCTLGWWAYGGLAIALFAASGGTITQLHLGIAFTWLVLPLPLLFRGLRIQRASSLIEDAEVGIALLEPRINRPLLFQYEQRCLRPAVLREASVALICLRRTGLASEPLYQASHLVSGPRELSNNEVLKLCHVFEIPAKKRRPSSPFSRVEYPRIDWLLEVRLAFQGGTDYRAQFPITVYPIAEDQRSAA